MPMPSDVLPNAPARRRRPDPGNPTHHPRRAPLHPDGALSFAPMTITSPHNEQLKQIRKLHRRRGRERSGHFVAEGEDLLAAADAAGWPAVERYCAAGSGLEGIEGEERLLARASALGSGTRAPPGYGQRWGVPAGPRGAYLRGLADPGTD